MIRSSMLAALCAALLCQSALAERDPKELASGARIPDARTALLNGYVTDAESGETLISATVQVLEHGKGSVTNKSGYYSIAGIPPGKAVVRVSFLGYVRQDLPVTFEAGRAVRLDVALRPEAVALGEVVVEGDRVRDDAQITVSRINVPAAQIQQIRVGGEADVFRSIQYLPGVLSSSQISSGLYIRGGSPDQTLVLLDGSTVYNPSHLFGFFSTFNPDAIKDVELIKGGYPAEYGGRLSAVLDLTQKDGNRNHFQGTASVGLISSRLTLQGPLGNGSWFIGGRRTYIDAVTALIETEEDPLPDYYFYDVNAKISQNIGTSDKIFLSGFLGKDNMLLDNRAGFSGEIGIGNRAASSRWTHLFSDNLFSVFTLSWSQYNNNFSNQSAGFSTKVENGISDVTLKGNIEWFPDADLNARAGIEINRYAFSFRQDFSGDADKDQPGSTRRGVFALDADDHTASAFAQATWQVTERFSAQAGLRANGYQLRSLLTWDPRMALRWQYDPDFTVKAAWGMYHQYFRLASLPDFSFFDTWLPTDSTVNPGRAVHYVLGVDTRPAPDIDLNVELYYKSLTHLSELNQFATQGTTVRDYFYDGQGEAYGFEVFVQKKTGRLTGWAGYALGFTNARFPEINQGRWFRPKWDRRHDLKLVAQYKLSDRWDVGATFTLQTGQSYTGMTSRTETRLPGDNVGRGVTVPADRYGLRLPPSHQLNVNVNYRSTLFGLPMTLLLDVFNVYSRRDIWFRYYDTSGELTEVKDVLLLPILPSIAIEVQF